MNDERMSWFREARFGMFIHWGLYSMLGRDASHPVASGEISPSDYERLADRFRPMPDCARQWAALAKRAGAGYVVFISKLHDGFCMFDSRITPYNTVQHGGRDYVREVAQCARGAGVAAGGVGRVVEDSRRVHPRRRAAAPVRVRFWPGDAEGPASLLPCALLAG